MDFLASQDCFLIRAGAIKSVITELRPLRAFAAWQVERVVGDAVGLGRYYVYPLLPLARPASSVHPACCAPSSSAT